MGTGGVPALRVLLGCACALLPFGAAPACCARVPRAPPPPPPQPPPQPPPHRCLPPPAPPRRQAHQGQGPPAGGACLVRQQRRFAAAWVSAWASMSVAAAALTLLALCTQPHKLRFPERPVALMAACAGARALALLLPPPGPARTARPPAHCLLPFIGVYYFQLCAGAWWCAGALCWFLFATRRWRRCAVEGLAPLLHACAWTAPAALAALALATDSVHPHRLTGRCQVEGRAALWLEALPHGALVLAGAALAACACASLLRLRARRERRLRRLAARVAVLCSLYALPAAGAVACLLFEKWAWGRWSSRELLAAVECALASPASPSPIAACAGHAHAEVALVREFLWLAAGGAAGAWVQRGRTWRAWRRLLAPPAPAPAPTDPAPTDHAPTNHAPPVLVAPPPAALPVK